MSKSILIAAAAITALSAASAGAETYPANAVEIVNAAAIVHVIPEHRSDVSVETSAGARIAAPSVRVVNGHVEVDGGLRNRIQGCGGNWVNIGDGRAARVRGVGLVREGDMPTVTIRTPMNVDVSLGGAVFSDIGAAQAAHVRVATCGGTEIGRITGALDLDARGSGSVRVGDVGALSAQFAGSGSVAAGRSGTASVTLSGSGSAQLADVTGTLNAHLSGSGSIRAASVGGEADLSATGSGSVRVGDVGGALRASLTGSGSLEGASAGGGANLSVSGSGGMRVAAVRGDLNARSTSSGGLEVGAYQGGNSELSASGSGSVRVRQASGDALRASATGSGGISFDGRVSSLVAELHGSGGISVMSVDHVERLIDQGSGSIHVGGR